MTLQFNPRKFFATEKNTLMLNYQTNPSGTLSLHADTFPVSEESPYESWFSVHVHGLNQHDDDTLYHGCVARTLLNRIAAATRRAAGNVLFVPNFDEFLRYSNCEQLLIGVNLQDLQVVIDYDLEPNELRATYWKCPPMWSGAVDGGVQFPPEGFVAQPAYRDFFWKTFL